MAQRKRSAAAVDAVALGAEVRAALARDGAVKLSSVKPASLRAGLAEALSSEGFEVNKAVIRQPLRAQLVAALEHGALVPVKSISAHVRGASAAELKRLIEEAVREGLARRVLRGAAEVLAGEGVRVLSSAEVEAMRLRVVGLGKALEKVTKKRGLSLLTSDAKGALEQAIMSVGERDDAQNAVKGAHSSVTPSKSSDEPMRALLAAVDSTRDVRSGLSFVPAIVGRLAPSVDTGAAIQLLLTAAERELLELRPEGGIGRLSEAELSVCPAGPHGTRLSWARRLTGGAS